MNKCEGEWWTTIAFNFYHSILTLCTYIHHIHLNHLQMVRQSKKIIIIILKKLWTSLIYIKDTIVAIINKNTG